MGLIHSLCRYTTEKEPSNQTKSSIDALSDSDVYALIETAIASGKILGDPATIRDLSPGRVWRISSDAIVKECDSSSEPFMMAYISTRTSIPMPKVRRVLPVDRDSTTCETEYLVMDYVEGDIFAVSWPTMSWWARFRVIWYMRSYIRQLHRLPLPFSGVAGRVDSSGRPLLNDGFYFTRGGAGPFYSYGDLAGFYDQRRFDHLVVAHRAYGKLIRGLPKFDRSQPLVVCHLDLRMHNIIVAADGRPWLIDWGFSGMFPAWMEYAYMASWGEIGMFQAPKWWIWSARFIVGNYDWYFSNYMRKLGWGVTDNGWDPEPADYFTSLGIDID